MRADAQQKAHEHAGPAEPNHKFFRQHSEPFLPTRKEVNSWKPLTGDPLWNETAKNAAYKLST
jgi:hypothetical protein